MAQSSCPIPETNFPPARCSLAGPLTPPAQLSGLRTRACGKGCGSRNCYPAPPHSFPWTSFEVSEGYRGHSVVESHDLCVKGLQEPSASLPAHQVLPTPGRLSLKSHPLLASVMLKVLFMCSPEGKAPCSASEVLLFVPQPPDVRDSRAPRQEHWPRESRESGDQSSRPSTVAGCCATLNIPICETQRHGPQRAPGTTGEVSTLHVLDGGHSLGDEGAWKVPHKASLALPTVSSCVSSPLSVPTSVPLLWLGWFPGPVMPVALRTPGCPSAGLRQSRIVSFRRPAPEGLAGTLGASDCGPAVRNPHVQRRPEWGDSFLEEALCRQ